MNFCYWLLGFVVWEWYTDVSRGVSLSWKFFLKWLLFNKLEASVNLFISCKRKRNRTLLSVPLTLNIDLALLWLSLIYLWSLVSLIISQIRNLFLLVCVGWCWLFFAREAVSLNDAARVICVEHWYTYILFVYINQNLWLWAVTLSVWTETSTHWLACVVARMPQFVFITNSMFVNHFPFMYWVLLQ